MRHRARSALLIVGLVALCSACGPPAGALVTQCSDEPMAVGSPWNCRITAERLTDEQTAAFKFDTPWSRVEVVAELVSTSGTAVVRIDSLAGRTWTIAPGAPAKIEVTAPFDRGLKGILLRVTPQGGPVDGVTGTLRYTGLPSP